MAKKGNTRRARKLRQRPRKTRKQQGGQPIGLGRLLPQAQRVPFGVRQFATKLPSQFQPAYKLSGTKIPKSAISTFETTQLQKILGAYNIPFAPRSKQADLAKLLEEELEARNLILNNTSDAPTAEPEIPNVENTANELARLIQENPLPIPVSTPESFSPLERITEALKIFERYFSPSAKIKLNLASLTPSNKILFQLTNTRSIKTRGIYSEKESTDFKNNMLQILDLVLQNSTKSEIENIIITFTPKRLAELRLAIFSIWLQNPTIANRIITILFGDIIPRNKFSPELMDGIITILKDPDIDDILTKLTKVSQQITETSLKHEQETVLAELKGRGWFKSQSLYRALMYGLGGLVLFIFVAMDITSIQGLSWKLKTEGGLPGLLESAQAQFAASNTAQTLGRVQEDVSSRFTFAKEQLSPGNVFRKSSSELQKQYANWIEAKRPKGFFEKLTNSFTWKGTPESQQMK